jgi:hypothetical protein
MIRNRKALRLQVALTGLAGHFEQTGCSSTLIMGQKISVYLQRHALDSSGISVGDRVTVPTNGRFANT